MPKSSALTEALGPRAAELFDKVGEKIKEIAPGPPLGTSELSPSGARGRARRDAEMLAEFLGRLGPAASIGLLTAGADAQNTPLGALLVDRFGPEVIQEAMRLAHTTASPEGGD